MTIDSNTHETSALLTVYDVAQFLNLSLNTVRRWNNVGILPSYRVGPRGDRRFRLDDVIGILGAEYPDKT